MRDGRSSSFMGGSLAILAVIALLAARPAAAGTADVIHSFGDGDGEYPATDLIVGPDGTIYGTTTQGGGLNSGTVFKLTPSGATWDESVIYSFTSGPDGGQPYNGVTLDAHGNLYGTAVTGGTGQACEGGCGVVYKLKYAGGTWNQTVLYNFTGGDDGSGPGAGLTLDHNGDLYGMTPTGGAFGLGVIYKLTMDGAGHWTQSVIHAFTGGDDGATGSAGRLLLYGGDLYGVATVGGANGKGTVFRLTPEPGGGWSFKTLYAFKGVPDGALPYGAVVRDSAGRLYGTTYYEGAYDQGAIYQLAPTPSGLWKERVIYSFPGGAQGGHPVAHLNLDASGNLYGTASEGGDPGCACGTVFKLTNLGAGHWQLTTVHAFTGNPDGANPYNGMAWGAGGNLYGATVLGGEDNDGVIFEVAP
jgi:uncharacterized repeat protein (TIGR03803 family)